jgi:hypothetical protein
VTAKTVARGRRLRSNEDNRAMTRDDKDRQRWARAAAAGTAAAGALGHRRLVTTVDILLQNKLVFFFIL